MTNEPRGRITPQLVRVARESRGWTRREAAKLTGIPFERYKSMEAWWTVPTGEELDNLCRVLHYPPAFFYQEELTDFSENSWERFHRTLIICDVCEWETGEDDVRARTKCIACKKDVCDIHYQTYKTTVALPHGGTKEVAVADYCDSCYRHFVTEPKRRATRQANLAKCEQL